MTETTAQELKKANKLVGTTVGEISLVDLAANNRRFPIMKRQQGIDEVKATVAYLDAIMPDCDAEAQTAIRVIKRRLLKQAGDEVKVSPDVQAAIEGARASIMASVGAKLETFETNLIAKITEAVATNAPPPASGTEAKPPATPAKEGDTPPATKEAETAGDDEPPTEAEMAEITAEASAEALAELGVGQ